MDNAAIAENSVATLTFQQLLSDLFERDRDNQLFALP